MRFKQECIRWFSSPFTTWWHVFLMFVAYSEGTIGQPFRFILVLLSVVAMALQDVKWEPYLLLGSIGCLLGGLWQGYFMAANHYFIIIYFSIFLFFRSLGLFPTWAYGKYLLILVMLLATVQKLISPYFMNGNFVGYLFLNGNFLWCNQWIFPSISDISRLFQQEFNAALQFQPLEFSLFPWAMPARFATYTRAMTYLIIGIEFLLAAYWMVAKPLARAWSIIFFIWLTFSFRQEHGFFCLLSFLAWYEVDQLSPRLSRMLRLNILILMLLKFIEMAFSQG